MFLRKCPCCGGRTMASLKMPEPHLFCVTCQYRRKLSKPPKNYYAKLAGRSKMLERDLKKKNGERLKYLWQHLKSGTRVLEVGCAEGFLGKKIKNSFKVAYYGVEPSRDAEVAATKLDRVWKSLEDIPTKMRFDFIFLFHTLEHVPDAGRLISKLRRLLEDGGMIVVEVPCEFGNRLLPWDYSKEHTHIFSPASILCLLEKHEFNIRKFSTGHFESAVYSDSMRVLATKRIPIGNLKKHLVAKFKRQLGRQYVIYGAGGDFKSLVLPYIKAADVFAVIDGSKGKIGSRTLGKKIQGPETIAKYLNKKFLVATYRYQKEIFKLLQKKGVNKAQIITLEDILSLSL